MFKYKPFLIFTVILAVLAITFISSFAVNAVINDKFDNLASSLSVVHLSSGKAFAAYKYDNIEYEAEIPYSSAIREGTMLPVYFDPSTPQNIRLKDLTAVYFLRYVPILLAIPFLIALIISAHKYQKKR